MIPPRLKFLNRYLPMILSVILLAAGIFTYLILHPSTKPAKATWLSSGTVNSGTWQYRRKIVVSHTQVSGTSTITNFPMLINSTLSDWKTTTNGGKVGNDNGYDFVFTASDGTTKLNHELETYASTTGQLIAWVNTGTQGLSPTADSVFYVYYGNSSATLTEANPTAVWDSNYKGVWHLNDNAANTTVLDSTSNAANLTAQQNTNLDATSTSFFPGLTSFYFNAATSSAATSTNAGLGFQQNMTWSGWIKPLTAGNQTVMNIGKAGGSSMVDIYRKGTVLEFSQPGQADYLSSVITIPNNAWTYFTFTKDYASTTAQNMTWYLNGVQVSSGTANIALRAYGEFDLGFCFSINCQSPFNGYLQEVRVASTTRSSDWIKTEYNNQNAPSYFYVFGGMEAQSSSALTPNDSTSGSVVPWLSSGTVNSGTWLYRKKIIIPHSLVSGTSTLSGFPVLVSNTLTDWKTTANGGDVGNANGYDFVFTNSGGQTKIPHELESYASTTGQLIAWVKTDLSPTTDTVLYLYFGNSSATLTEANPTAVWDTYYKGVWHLNDNAANTTVLDSTSNADNLGASYNTNSIATSTAMFGATSFYFNGQLATSSTAIIASSTNANLLLTNNLTWSAWVNDATTTASNVAIMSEGGTTFGSGTDGALQLYRSSAAGVYLANKSGYYAMVQSSYGTPNVRNFWNYIVVTDSGSSPYQWAIYINGVQAGTASTANTIGAGTRFQLGYTLQYYSNQTLQGYLDEARVSNTVRSAGWIQTEYNNQKSPSVFAVIGQTEAYSRSAVTPDVKLASRSGSVPGWYSTGGTWAYRRKLTIDPKLVYDSSGLTNFPMLFRETLSDLKYSGSGGKVASSTGADIVFTGADGTLLNYERENYASTTGESEFWIKVPFVSPTSTTQLFMYYGNANAADQATTTGVWDSNYKGVWHLNNNASSTTITDSTGDYSGVNSVNTNTKSVSGQIGSALTYASASSNYTDIASSTSQDAYPLTISAWFKTSMTSQCASHDIFNKYVPNSVNGYRLGFQTGCKIEAWYFSSGGGRVYSPNPVSPNAMNDNKWHLVDYVLNSTGGNLYMDGISVSSAAWSSGSASSTTQTQDIYFNRYGTVYSDTTLDEVRFSNIARSAGWIKSEYINQSSPQQFYSLGGAEVASGRQTSSGAAGAPAVKLRGGVKFR